MSILLSKLALINAAAIVRAQLGSQSTAVPVSSIDDVVGMLSKCMYLIVGIHRRGHVASLLSDLPVDLRRDNIPFYSFQQKTGI